MSLVISQQSAALRQLSALGLVTSVISAATGRGLSVRPAAEACALESGAPPKEGERGGLPAQWAL